VLVESMPSVAGRCSVLDTVIVHSCQFVDAKGNGRWLLVNILVNTPDSPAKPTFKF
jgi:hypothetical protein